jgi:putative membrane protein
MTNTLPLFMNSLVFAGLGILIFIVSFVLVDKLTPGQLWQEIIERKNTAVALLAGAVAIGISIIIAAAIHG